MAIELPALLREFRLWLRDIRLFTFRIPKGKYAIVGWAIVVSMWTMSVGILALSWILNWRR